MYYLLMIMITSTQNSIFFTTVMHSPVTPTLTEYNLSMVIFTQWLLTVQCLRNYFCCCESVLFFMCYCTV